jgi:hypothetical protein
MAQGKGSAEDTVIATAQAEGPAVGTQVIATAQGKDLQKTQ